MSQEDRSLSHGVPQLEDTSVFLAQRRSCRCGSSSPNDDNDETTITEDSQLRLENTTMESSIDEFVIDIDSVESREHDDDNRNETMNLDNDIGTCEMEQSVEKLNAEPDDEHFSQIHEKSRCSSDYRENDDLVDGDLDQRDFNVSPNHETSRQFIYEPRGRSSNPSIHMTRTQTRLTSDFSLDEIDGDDEIDDERLRERSSIIDSRNIACLTETRSSPSRINDERPSTAGSSISFATSCSSANETTNNTRVHGRHDSNVNENVLNRSQTNTKLHQQLPVIMNAFNANRSNQRSSRDKRCNTNDDDHHEIDDIHRINSNTANVGGVTYSPGFRNLHNEHIIQPLHRGNNVIAKGTFDNIQVTRSNNTMEKSKCQCHRIQQHQNQQILSQIQQRDTGHQHLHHHHHRHQQNQQQQQHQQHRHKTTQQPSQPQQQYRHNHYHHPHQHIGQQQEHQRSQNDQNAGRKQRNGSETDDESNEIMETGPGNHQPPALPPRPPPRPNRRYEENAITAYDLGPNNGEDAGCCKKYVVLCCLCGGLSAAVGSLFLAVHAVLSAHTASLALFETVPSYIPGTMLILMGLFTILLARRKHRYGILMKMCGSVGVVCALVCVLVTVTTTVVHMSRLQGLRQCIYTERARSCTCYATTEGRILTEPGVLFEETPHCEAVHGALYDCLRALFGVSVAGILACIFSCMLLYQLLSHEKKKMYWEQLQLRCRSLYSQGGSGAVGGPTGGSCGCCNDCNGGAGPWWAQTPGNLYTPNPDMAPFSRRWRLPWSRSRGPAPTPDSNYGFNTQSRGAVAMRSSDSSSGEPVDNAPGPYSVLADESQTGGVAYSLLNGPGSTPYAACTSSIASYSLLESGPVPALWGPPPPYSDPNSPARRSQVNDDRRVSSTIRPHSTIESSAAIPANMSTNRISTGKRTMDNFDPDTINEEYRQQRGTSKRPSDNYENAEEVLSSGTDPDIDLGNQQQHLHHHHHHHHHTQRQQDEDATKGRRIRKSLKGVENGGFQQESGNPVIKQTESELYFGDVSSCCGPESSFYDLAVDKEQLSVDPSNDSLNEYPSSIRAGKQRQSSKRSRLPLPLPSTNPEVSVGSVSENYTPLNNQTVVEDLSRNSSTRGPYLAPDAQYEVIAAQQSRYTYYNPKSGERVLEIPLSSLANISPYRNGNSMEKFDDQRDNRVVDYTNDCSRLSMEQCPNNDGMNVTTMSTTSTDVTVMSVPPSPLSCVSNSNQRCSSDTNGNSRDSLQNELQNQIRTAQSNEIVCPVNV